jgi:hypothetical protein
LAFQKGQSGNPGGRRKPDEVVVNLAREASPRAMGRLIELLEHREPRTVIAAATIIMERAYGKPTQPISGDSSMDPIDVKVTAEVVARLTKDERAQLRTIARRLAP